MLNLIATRLERSVCDDVLEVAWSTMWNVTDETPANCRRFLENRGMEFFLGCLKVRDVRYQQLNWFYHCIISERPRLIPEVVRSGSIFGPASNYFCWASLSFSELKVSAQLAYLFESSVEQILSSTWLPCFFELVGSIYVMPVSSRCFLSPLETRCRGAVQLCSDKHPPLNDPIVLQMLAHVIL